MADTTLIALVAGGLVVVLESSLRFLRWRYAPPRLRMRYALWLLPAEVVQAVAEIHQRVERAGVRSFDELFALYAIASGRTLQEVEDLFGFPAGRLRAKRGLVLRNYLRWHVGIVPIPGQHLRTVTITSEGVRRTGAPDPGAAPQESRAVKRVVVTGGSVAFGYGATADGNTIAGRLRHHLNRIDHRGQYSWEVVNLAVPAATSFQELIAALQHVDAGRPPDYLISVSGWNDVDQQFGHGEPNVSAFAQAYTTALEEPLLRSAVRLLLSRVVLLSILKRLVRSYEQWPGPQSARAGADTLSVDGPDMYPLW